MLDSFTKLFTLFFDLPLIKRYNYIGSVFCSFAEDNGH